MLKHHEARRARIFSHVQYVNQESVPMHGDRFSSVIVRHPFSEITPDALFYPIWWCELSKHEAGGVEEQVLGCSS